MKHPACDTCVYFVVASDGKTVCVAPGPPCVRSESTVPGPTQYKPNIIYKCDRCEKTHTHPKSDKAIDEGWTVMEADIKTGKGDKVTKQNIMVVLCPEHSSAESAVAIFKEKEFKEKPLPDWLKVAAGGRIE